MGEMHGYRTGCKRVTKPFEMGAIEGLNRLLVTNSEPLKKMPQMLVVFNCDQSGLSSHFSVTDGCCFSTLWVLTCTSFKRNYDSKFLHVTGDKNLLTFQKYF